MPLTVKASEARAQFPTIAKRVYEDNIEVTVIKGSKPYVKIVPIDDNASICLRLCRNERARSFSHTQAYRARHS